VTRASLLYLASFGAHAVLAAGVVSMRGARKFEDISVAVIEKAKPEAKKAPPPPPPEPPAPKAEAKAKAAPKPAIAKPVDEAPPPSAGAPTGNDVPDFGLSLGGGGTGGLAVPASAPRAQAAPASTVQVSKKLLAAPAPTQDVCADPPTKPKVIAIGQPAYTQEARDANIAGKVRVELTVDASGKVASARVLEGLGHGLDEAALAAARAATFEPATRCGKAASATFVVAMRFAL
jgi:protein TonB